MDCGDQGPGAVFIHHSSETYTLTDPDGVIVWEMSAAEADTHWGPLEKFTDEWLGLDCPMPTVWASWWSYPIPVELTVVGTYTLLYTGVFDQPVNDGLHACTELPSPNPPIPTPSLFRGEVFAVSTIVVAAPPPP